MERLTQRRGEYDLDDWFTTLMPADDVAYRHEVFRNLETPALREGLTGFSRGLRYVRRILTMAAKRDYESEQRRWFLEVAHDYVMTVRGLSDTL